MWSHENLCSVELHNQSCDLEGKLWRQSLGSFRARTGGPGKLEAHVGAQMKNSEA